ncbi:MAG: DNA alkylation repair protein [Planctomycetes bacterium]|nr:DNA alkylation repair protein [Planctomycetota bacterium]
MTTLKQVMKTLKAKGNDRTRNIYASHALSGDEYFGVPAADLKLVAKSIKGDQDLAVELYDTGNRDAMYLAGLVADGRQMSKKQLEAWVKEANWIWSSEYVVPWVAAESAHGRALALKWIDAKKEHIAAAGWSTYSGIVATTEDENLDFGEIKNLLKRIETEIDGAQGRVRYTMNGFVIAVGGLVVPLVKQAQASAKKIGKVEVDMGKTACKVPFASDYITKMHKSGRAGKKRKVARC